MSINLFVRSRFWAWALLPHSTKKEPSLSLLMFFRVPAMAPSELQKGITFAEREIFIRRLGYQKPGPVCFTFHEHLIVGICIRVVIQYSFLDWCFVAIVCCVMFHYVLSPPATESNKGMHTSRNSSKCAPGLKMQYTQVIKTKQSLLLSPD